MMPLFSALSFSQPIMLAGLLALPLLWFILRLTPPAPQRVFFPAARFLDGLISEEKTPSSTPWWLLLLRLLIAALLIIALARPVLNPSEALTERGDLRLIIENSWSSAPHWEQKMKTAQGLIEQAERENRKVYIYPTTANVGQEEIELFGPLTRNEALSTLKSLRINPWPSDYKRLAQQITETRAQGSFYNIWLSDGTTSLDSSAISALSDTLQKGGNLEVKQPNEENLPLLLRASKSRATNANNPHISIALDAPPHIQQGARATVQAIGQGGSLIDLRSVQIAPNTLPYDVIFDDEKTAQSALTQFKIASQRGAGAIYLMDASAQRKNVGIVASERKERDTPLTEGSYYIRRALETNARIISGDLIDILKKDIAVLALPDISAMPADTLNQVEQWIEEDGGILIRFAGPKMSDTRSQQPFLLPVAIRSGGRALSGSLSWDEPQRIAPIPENSPLYGLSVPEDIRVSQQVLADPAQDLIGKIWASLEDGTPFITAAPQGKGLIVLFHTTADTRWSNFALSSLFMHSLERITEMAGQANKKQLGTQFKFLEAERILDGYGQLQDAPPVLKPIDGASLNDIEVSQHIPPGYYGNGTRSIAINLGDHLGPLRTLTDFLSAEVVKSYYQKTVEQPLSPFFLALAFALFLCDWVIMLIYAGLLSKILNLKIPRLSATIFILCLWSAQTASAQSFSEAQYANELFLAYIKTGDANLDIQTELGLETLKNALTRRTSVEPAGIVGLIPERDELAFFPIIYWPISEAQKSLSIKALQNIQNYLNNGGTILFDTRDQNSSTSNASLTARSEKLREITASLDIPPIAPIPEKHVLGRSFYILKSFPGRYENGVIWAEKQSAQGRDNVSSVIVGSNDWGASWAQSTRSAAQDRYSYSGAARQREMALRFGVNLVIYALTGNYKADQVHIDYLLERIGE